MTIFALILFGYGPVISCGFDPVRYAKHKLMIGFMRRGVMHELWVWDRKSAFEDY